ncbi:hypothetical protein FWC31_01860 [Candidatus Saccharibacteria bacterium]|nr:hypothetical protein [Candidatus Saccharibacteria bacterium]
MSAAFSTGSLTDEHKNNVFDWIDSLKQIAISGTEKENRANFKRVKRTRKLAEKAIRLAMGGDQFVEAVSMAIDAGHNLVSEQEMNDIMKLGIERNAHSALGNVLGMLGVSDVFDFKAIDDIESDKERLEIKEVRSSLYTMLEKQIEPSIVKKIRAATVDKLNAKKNQIKHAQDENALNKLLDEELLSKNELLNKAVKIALLYAAWGNVTTARKVFGDDALKQNIAANHKKFGDKLDTLVRELNEEAEIDANNLKIINQKSPEELIELIDKYT